MDIVIDFDGTVVTHDYPRIGRDIGAISVLRELVSFEHNLILFTMRSGEHLNKAIKWFEKNEIPLYGVQKNPTQHTWTTSPKAYGQIIIDDAALGCPLIDNLDDRPYVDWNKVREYLVNKKLLN